MHSFQRTKEPNHPHIHVLAIKIPKWNGKYFILSALTQKSLFYSLFQKVKNISLMLDAITLAFSGQESSYIIKCWINSDKKGIRNANKCINSWQNRNKRVNT